MYDESVYDIDAFVYDASIYKGGEEQGDGWGAGHGHGGTGHLVWVTWLEYP